MTALIIVLIILLALGVLGAVVKGLLWLTAIALVLALAGMAFGWWRFRGSSSAAH